MTRHRERLLALNVAAEDLGNGLMTFRAHAAGCTITPILPADAENPLVFTGAEISAALADVEAELALGDPTFERAAVLATVISVIKHAKISA